MFKEFHLHIASNRGKIKPTTALMEPSPTLQFTMTYPLTNPYHFSETHANGTGWTEIQFCEAVRRAYQHVYTVEGPDPEPTGLLLNRPKSNGQFGIWGHSLDDLCLEGAKKLSNGQWELCLGS